jgi:hypothetical protein
MSPIKGLSEIRGLPRLGKVHLGEKVKAPGKNPYPRATDYFVVPEEIQPYVGEKPKKLSIMLPVEDSEVFAPQFMKCYSMSQGLVCRGDGVSCSRKVDTETGAVADHTTEQWEFRDMSCDPDTCPESVGDTEEGIRPQCRRVMNLLFMLPDVPGLGVWQLDTSSFYSIVNINSCIDVIRGLCGRISGIPLTLSLEPREVTPPGMKKKTVNVLHLRSDLKLSQLQRLALKAAAKCLAMPSAEEEEPPEDLFPEEVLAESEGLSPEAAPEPLESQPRPRREPETICSINELYRACNEDFVVTGEDGKPRKMQPKDVLKELGVSSKSEICELPSECYRRIAAVR